MGGFLRKLIQRPDVQKILKQPEKPKKKVVKEKKDTVLTSKRKGRSSTIITSASGLNDEEIKKKSLLG